MKKSSFLFGSVKNIASICMYKKLNHEYNKQNKER